jgi:CspA family cold shock protein
METENKQEVQEAQEDLLEEVKEGESYGQITGHTKWFNDKLGYGFITICDGNDKGKDIFVHHSGIKPLNSNYKTLRKGEYIQFNIINGMNGLQAVDVTGIKGGPLMCDYVTNKRVMVAPVTDWQTVPYRKIVRGGPPGGPPHGGRGVGGRGTYKNVAKYNKATRS